MAMSEGDARYWITFNNEKHWACLAAWNDCPFTVSQNPSWLYPCNYRLKETWETGLSTCRRRNGQSFERVRPFVTTGIDLTVSLSRVCQYDENRTGRLHGLSPKRRKDLKKNDSNNIWPCRIQIGIFATLSFFLLFIFSFSWFLMLFVKEDIEIEIKQETSLPK